MPLTYFLSGGVPYFGNEGVTRGFVFEAQNVFGDVDEKRVELTFVPFRENVSHLVVT